MTSVFTARCYAKQSAVLLLKVVRLSVTLMTVGVCVGYVVPQ